MHAVKFCVKLNRTPKETWDMHKEAFGDACIFYSQAKKWHKSFRKGREDVTDEARSGHPSTSRTDEHLTRVRELLNTDRRMSVRMMSELLNLSKTIIHENVLKDLVMRKICAKFVPKVLTDAQKVNRIEVCKELKQFCANNLSFLDNDITGDGHRYLNTIRSQSVRVRSDTR